MDALEQEMHNSKIREVREAYEQGVWAGYTHAKKKVKQKWAKNCEKFQEEHPEW